LISAVSALLALLGQVSFVLVLPRCVYTLTKLPTPTALPAPSRNDEPWADRRKL
jgi:hypothetical protein